MFLLAQVLLTSPALGWQPEWTLARESFPTQCVQPPHLQAGHSGLLRAHADVTVYTDAEQRRHHPMEHSDLRPECLLVRTSFGSEMNFTFTFQRGLFKKYMCVGYNH